MCNSLNKVNKILKKDILHGNRKENPKIHVKAGKIPNGHRTPETEEQSWRDGLR